jgi:ABC-type lipoprotein release transport system permease subunit
MEGVVAISPEVIAPCTINGQSVFIRGVIPQEVFKLNPLSIIEGQTLNITDTNAAIIGQALSDRMHLKTGDKIVAFSVLSKQYVELQVKGVFHSASSLNDEALVPLYVGQWLRGLSYNDVTLIRAKIDVTQTSALQIYQQIANQTTPSPGSTSPSPTPKSETQHELEALIPLTQANLNVGNIGIAQSQEFMQNYLDRYGISKDTLIILSIVVLVFASGTAICAITLFIKQHSSDIEILRSIGVSNKKMKADLTIKMVTWALIATALGTIISAVVITAFQKVGYLQVLSHTITFQLDPLIIAANFILLSALISINIARTELKQ